MCIFDTGFALHDSFTGFFVPQYTNILKVHKASYLAAEVNNFIGYYRLIWHIEVNTQSLQ